MGDPNGPRLQRGEILAAFNTRQVEFLLVGGVAAQIWGAQRPTYDLDLCVHWTPQNLDRVGAALTDLDAGMRIEGLDESFPVPHRDGRFLSTLELSTWRTPAGDVDILRNLPAPDTYAVYADLLARSSIVEIDGHRVAVASLADIIVSKETIDRPPDRAALPELRELHARTHPAPPTPPPA